MPKLANFGFQTEPVQDPKSCLVFKGGENEGLKRVTDYIEIKRSLGHYSETRNELIGSEYSSKFSPWLANGSVSPRHIFN